MKKQGYTLVEVICAIVIVGIVFIAMSSMLVSSTRINKKFIVKENMVAEVESLFNLFSGDPIEFKNNVEKIYKVVDEDTTDGKYKIYFNDKFISSTSKEDNYIIYSYSNVNDTYTLKIEEVNYNNAIVDGYSELVRSIRIKEETPNA